MIRRKLMVAASAMTLPLLSTACSLAPKYVQPETPVPPSWPSGDAYSASTVSSLPEISYQDLFRDPRLQSLVVQALENNRDLRIAAANVSTARSQITVVRASQFPAVGVSGSATYADNGGNSQADWSYNLLGGVSSFELDLFGKLANATESQREYALATEAAAQTVRIGLIADIASAWAAYGADKDLLAIAQATADIAERSVSLTSARLKGGIAPRTDLRQAEQILETARGDLARQKTALAQDENIIRLLVGSEFDHSLLPGSIAEVTGSLNALPAGTSSEILLRRPDVLEAEHRLRSANADIGVARAQLFPSISLTGLLGLASDSLSSLFSDGAFHYSAGGDAAWSIFNAGGRAANVDVSKAQRDAALASYEKSIQTAFREVSDALADQGTLDERVRAAGANTDAAADTAKLTEARYQHGVDSFLANLDAQRSLYTARRAEVAVNLALAVNRITLYRVLGGDAVTASNAGS